MKVPRLWPRSLYARLLAGTAIWTLAALLVSALVLTQAFRDSAEEGFRSLLEAHSFNVMGALERDASGRLRGTPDLRDPRFQTPLSGWSWAAFDARDRIASASLASGRLEVPEVAFDPMFQRVAQIEGPMGRDLLVLEAQLFVDDGAEPVTVQVAGDASQIDEQVAIFRRTLVVFFLLFGLGLVLATAIVLRIGLRPLDRVRAQLAAIRDGEQESIAGEQPREIRPLVEEVNALLASNREVIERARRQVGNLAHGLKTPLTVLRNEAAGAKGALPKLVGEQVDAMRAQVDTYLDRARIAAVRQSARARAPVGPIVQRLVRTIAKLSPGIEVHAAPVEADCVFAGDASDLEEVLGNLMENASRFAASRIAVSATIEGGRVLVAVDDDGPGLSDDEMRDAASRGVRLDERRSGSGLGLSIVAEIVEAYDGAFTMERSPLGGLRASVRLPYASRPKGGTG